MNSKSELLQAGEFICDRSFNRHFSQTKIICLPYVQFFITFTYMYKYNQSN